MKSASVIPASSENILDNEKLSICLSILKTYLSISFLIISMIHFILAAPKFISTRKLVCFAKETCHLDLAVEMFNFFLHTCTVSPPLIHQCRVLYSETGKSMQTC